MTITFERAVKPILPVADWVYEHRLLDRVEVDEDGCWIWQGPPQPSGYGIIRAWHRGWLTHRLAYTVMVGPIPDELQIDHLCRKRMCISPFDLEAVTQVENLRRQGRAVLFCPEGHEYTPENTYRAPSSPHMRRCRECTRIRNQVAAAARRAAA